MPLSRSRRRPLPPASHNESLKVKPKGVFSLFGNAKLFYVIGVVVMAGSLLPIGLQGAGFLHGGSSSPHSNNDFVLPEDFQQDGAAEPAEVQTDGETETSAPAVRTYSTVPFFSIDPRKTYTATVRTEAGDIVIRLAAEAAPAAVSNFVFLARDGFYDQGISFHYVVPGFVAQTGDPTGSGSGDAGYELAQEAVSGTDFGRGTVALANSSQFFFTLSDLPQLAGEFTPIGEVIEGLDILESLPPHSPRDRDSGPGLRVTAVEVTKEA